MWFPVTETSRWRCWRLPVLGPIPHRTIEGPSLCHADKASRNGLDLHRPLLNYVVENNL